MSSFPAGHPLSAPGPILRFTPFTGGRLAARSANFRNPHPRHPCLRGCRREDAVGRGRRVRLGGGRASRRRSHPAARPPGGRINNPGPAISPAGERDRATFPPCALPPVVPRFAPPTPFWLCCLPPQRHRRRRAENWDWGRARSCGKWPAQPLRPAPKGRCCTHLLRG